METAAWRLFWAKTNREKIKDLPEDWTHPLWAHLLDVASAAQVLWDSFLPEVLKAQLAAGIGLPADEAGRFLSLWIGLHDLGKAIPTFQEMHGPSKEKLQTAGLQMLPDARRLHHGHASIAIVHNWLLARGHVKNEPGNYQQTLLMPLFAMVGIHHGKLCNLRLLRKEISQLKRPTGYLGDEAWQQQQAALLEAVMAAWGSGLPAFTPQSNLPWPDWLMAFAGWATLSDWLGSMQTCYENVAADADLKAYLPKSLKGAQKAFRQAELHHKGQLKARAFEEHFGFEPRPLQQLATRLPIAADAPMLVIGEASTGEGKSEFSFYLSARFGRGVYVAMPSQATSNGIHPRVRDFIGGAGGRPPAHVGTEAALRLVHGNDILQEEARLLLALDTSITATYAEAGQGNREQQKRDMALEKAAVLNWFTPKKRSLLVPYGIGTVDQLFLGVMHSKHFFLRLFSLTGKTVVFDEVHAYDAYMNTLFMHLLGWLRALHVNVIILSATLPAKTRQAMLTAWGAAGSPALDATQPVPYPMVWTAQAGQAAAYACPPAPGRTQRVKLRWCESSVAAIVAKARFYLKKKAVVLVICNTVRRAQAVYQQLTADALVGEEDQLLLHARMPQRLRNERERQALARFGKGRKSGKALLVGTQIIEQSLDLDADVMISDLAPIDLLLQRAGRLHRHRREDRPNGAKRPVFIVACDTAAPGQWPNVSKLSGGGRIYDIAILWKTWQLLRQTGGWLLPNGKGRLPGYRSLVEAVYGDPEMIAPTDAMTQALEREIKKAIKEQGTLVAEAQGRLIPAPLNVKGLFTFHKPELAEADDQTSSDLPRYLQAATRDPRSVQAEVVLLYPTATGWCTEPGKADVLSANEERLLSIEKIRELFGASLRLSHRGVLEHLWAHMPEAWQRQQERHKLLKRFYLIELDTNHQAQLGSHKLRLDARLGLLIDEEEESLQG